MSGSPLAICHLPCSVLNTFFEREPNRCHVPTQCLDKPRIHSADKFTGYRCEVLAYRRELLNFLQNCQSRTAEHLSVNVCRSTDFVYLVRTGAFNFEPLLARMEITDDELQDLYVWVDDIELSRPKRNIARDFADGGITFEGS